MANGNGVLGWTPKLWAAVVGLVAYGIVACFLSFRWWKSVKPRRWTLVLVVGAWTMTLGFLIRIIWGIGDNVDSIPVYAIQNLFLLLSPCAYLAFSYMVLPRLATYLDAEDCLFLRSRWIVRIFVTADVVTFLTQASGGGMAASGGDMAKTGDKLTLGGLILQVISFGLFTFLTVWFGYRSRSRHMVWTSRNPSAGQRFFNRWTTLYYVLLLTCVAYLTRCIFRVAEFVNGYDSYLATHEGYFYLLDALPLVIAISLFFFVWPPSIFAHDANALDGGSREYATAIGSPSYDPENKGTDVEMRHV
ncbi:hypothetical protein FFLO_05117 [Filobasidium floriforme]|uniref:RTA1-like protein n=1 Tax=Filobasidium floriforme TaxID=5210 RepID=A0A8K0JHL7_9TREE|nr:hypothetical protein FFLO_05117 [Filobasidium floriforme]